MIGKKRVRIATSTTHYFTSSDDDDNDDITDEQPAKKSKNVKWFSRKEIACMRFRVKESISKINLDPVLQNVFVEPSAGVGAKAPNMANDDSNNRGDNLLECKEFLEQRGLERWSGSHHSFLRTMKIFECRSEVLLEQSAQVLSGKPDPERLCTASQEASRASQRFAELLGDLDAKFIERLRRRERECNRMNEI